MSTRQRPSFVKFFPPTEEEMTPEEHRRFLAFYNAFARVQPAPPDEPTKELDHAAGQ